MNFLKRFRTASCRSMCSVALLPGLALTATAFVAPVQAALAQPSQARTLDGKVVAGGQPAKGAVVHLKDTRTLSQKSYITSDDGSYRFAQLSGTSDYEVWAEVNGKKSPVKTISSFDNKSNFNFVLKVD